jgi:hypothetical protein
MGTVHRFRMRTFCRQLYLPSFLQATCRLSRCKWKVRLPRDAMSALRIPTLEIMDHHQPMSRAQSPLRCWRPINQHETLIYLHAVLIRCQELTYSAAVHPSVPSFRPECLVATKSFHQKSSTAEVGVPSKSALDHAQSQFREGV